MAIDNKTVFRRWSGIQVMDIFISLASVDASMSNIPCTFLDSCYVFLIAVSLVQIFMR